MESRFYPLDIKSDGNGIRLFCRLEDGEKVYIVDGFEPYFWLIPKFELDKEEIEKIRVGDSFVTRAEEHDMFILRRPVKALKVFVNDARAIVALSKYLEGLGFGEVREADIPFVKRYILDKELVFGGLYEYEGNVFKYTGDILKPKIISFDIETFGDEIATIAFFGNSYKKVISAKTVEGAEDYIEFVKDEEKLLERFFEVLEETDPDYLVGYFSDGFDLPHIKKRCEFYGVANMISVKKGYAKIEGAIHLDVFKFIRNVIGDSLKSENLTLNNVAKELVGEGKEKVDENIFIGGDIKQLCSYNLKDAELTFRIFEKLLPNINDLVRLVGQPVFDVCRMSFGNLVEWYLIKKIKNYKELCANEPSFSEREQRRKKSYKGAFVFEPKPGLYEDVAFLDFKSLYPSIIIAKNICISTYKDEKFGKEQGLIPELLKEIIIKRNEIKKICKGDPVLEAQSYSLKILANAIYGYFGYFNARWYCIEAARAITLWGRRFITRAAKNAEGFGFKVIYGDTDSIALIGAKKKLDSKNVLEFLQETNKKLPMFMELELQGLYERGLFVSKKASVSGAKKKYALISSDGIVIKGFESVRGDWSGIARDVQKEVLKLVLKGRVEEAISYTRQIIKDINEKRVEIEKMVIETQLKKKLENYEAIGPHVAAARILNERGFDVQPGMRIGYVVCGEKGKIRDRIQIPQEAKDYDAGYYINNQVLKVVERIFEAIGCDTKMLKDGQRKLI